MTRWLVPAISLLALSGCEPSGEPPGGSPIESIPAAEAAALYRQNCSICHGESGDGHGPRRGSLYNKPPDFRQPYWRRDRAAAEIRSLIRNGRPGTDMPAWKSLDEREIAGLAEHVLGFSEGASGRSL
jgi:mono/diheme cytochrome c family protein